MRSLYPFQSSKTFPLINPVILPNVGGILQGTVDCSANDYIYQDGFSEKSASTCFISENLTQRISKSALTQIADSRYCAHLFTILNTISCYPTEYSRNFNEPDTDKPFWYILQYLCTLEELFPPQRPAGNTTKFLSLIKDISQEEGHYLVKLFRRKVYNLYLKLHVKPLLLQAQCNHIIKLYQLDIDIPNYDRLSIEYKALGHHLIQKSNRILKDYQIYYMNKTIIVNTESPEECLSNTYIPEFVPILKDFYYKDPLKSKAQIAKDLAFLNDLEEILNKIT